MGQILENTHKAIPLTHIRDNAAYHAYDTYDNDTYHSYDTYDTCHAYDTYDTSDTCSI